MIRIILQLCLVFTICLNEAFASRASTGLSGLQSLSMCPSMFVGPGELHNLSALLVSLGLDPTKIKTERWPVLADPFRAFVRYFVKRSIMIDGIQFEITNFENEIGFANDLVDAAKKENLWPKDDSGYLSLPLDKISFISVTQAQASLLGLNVADIQKLQSIADDLAREGTRIALATERETSSFVFAHEQRRGWTQGLFSHLKESAPLFHGSTTSINVRDPESKDLFGSMSFVRAPYGGRTNISVVNNTVNTDVTFGCWGPLYKRLAALNPTSILTPDTVMFTHAQQMARALGNVLHTKLLLETYVPEDVVPDRKDFSENVYAGLTSPDGKHSELWWQHEFIEPRGFAFARHHRLRGKALALVMILSFAIVLDPFSGTSMDEVPPRTFLFPNDEVGIALYDRFGFNPRGRRFDVFGMKNWALLVAQSQAFHNALVRLIRALKSGDSEIDEIARSAERLYIEN